MADNNKIDSICYEKNFLKEVLIRLDFVRNIDQFAKGVPQDIIEVIEKDYPNAKPQKIFKGRSVEFKNNEMQLGEKDEFPEFSFTNDDDSKKIAISPKYIWIDHFKYKTWNLLKNDFLAVADALIKKYPDIESQKLGIRFINEIELTSEDNPFSWDSYINQNLLNALNFSASKDNIIRIFSLIEFIYDDFKIKVQFGMPNPEYPSKIQRKVFVLDYDAICTARLNLTDMGTVIEKMHDEILTIFEESITPKFRDLLDGK